MKKQARELTPKGSVEQGRRGQAHWLKDGALEGRSDEGLLEQRQGKGGEVDDSEASPNEAELQSGCRGGGKGKASDARWPGLLFGGRLACLVVLSQSVQLGTEQTGYISSGSRNSLREKKNDLISEKISCYWLETQSLLNLGLPLPQMFSSNF